MSEIGFTVIGFAIGYFWAVYRADNIRLRIDTFNNSVSLNVREFWRQAEAWRARQNEADAKQLEHQP